MSTREDVEGETTSAIATLAGGCFWCLEAVFEQLHGVNQVVSGYSGGHTQNPSYYDVCTETTGHAEVVQVTFDPTLIPYRDLLQIFFAIHDPTTLNAQGPDTGTQYRSAIFYHDDAQRVEGAKAIRDLDEAKTWKNSIVTELTPLAAFFPAESYHQEYYRTNRNAPYCRIIIEPKLAKFIKSYGEKLK